MEKRCRAYRGAGSLLALIPSVDQPTPLRHGENRGKAIEALEWRTIEKEKGPEFRAFLDSID
ncbi:MAG: hypothetical protein ACYDBT_11630 [Desulfobulbaceae bacterium]